MNFLNLIRYKNLIMVILTMLLVKYALLSLSDKETSFTLFFFIVSCFSILCMTAAGYIVNDMIDLKADLINKPHKIFIGKGIHKNFSWRMYAVLNVLGLGSCFYVLKTLSFTYDYFAIYAGTIFFLYLYSKYLKRLLFLGNMVIAFFCSGIVLVTFSLDMEGQSQMGFIWKAFENSFDKIGIFMIVFYYAVFSFISTLIREIIKDIEDVNGDYQMKMYTLPIALGRKRTRNIVIALSLLLLLLLILVLIGLTKNPQFLFLNLYLLLFVLVPTLYFTFVLWTAKTKSQFHFLSTLMKIIMLLGIFSMLLFIFV